MTPVLAHCFATSGYSAAGHSGVPEAPSGYPKSPPSGRRIPSKYYAVQAGGARSLTMKGASKVIAKECERLLCGDMKRIFFGGKLDSNNVSRSMGSIGGRDSKFGIYSDSSSDSSDGSDDSDDDGNNITDEMRYIEVWDYVGGTSFRGFIADKVLPRGGVEKTLFLFFEHVADTELKHGLMALIELATECFSCDRLVICLERNAEGLNGLMCDLGWVGFELATLAHWNHTDMPLRPSSSARCGSFSSVSTSSSIFSDNNEDLEITSEKWLFMAMEL
ncbi:ornithine decarboxylase antizyme-domain-containing protein [Pyronema omphalodes]|nr:ornithine decarboxylase antizyme-domain-containing protein [Pyronema omphalodes]